MYINIPDSDNVITAQHKHVDRKKEYEILQKVTWGDTQCHCSNIHQGGNGSLLLWLSWLSIVFGITVMVLKLKYGRPDTWTLFHLIQLKQKYKKLVEDFNCDFQEYMTVQDAPAPPSKVLLLPPLTSRMTNIVTLTLTQIRGCLRN
jgi:hypothetical protein